MGLRFHRRYIRAADPSIRLREKVRISKQTNLTSEKYVALRRLRGPEAARFL